MTNPVLFAELCVLCFSYLIWSFIKLHVEEYLFCVNLHVSTDTFPSHQEWARLVSNKTGVLFLMLNEQCKWSQVRLNCIYWIKFKRVKTILEIRSGDFGIGVWCESEEERSGFSGLFNSHKLWAWVLIKQTCVTQFLHYTPKKQSVWRVTGKSE